MYNSSPSDSNTSYYVRGHDGQGLGSIFAKIFSKVAVKTAAKAAAKTLGTAANVEMPQHGKSN